MSAPERQSIHVAGLLALLRRELVAARREKFERGRVAPERWQAIDAAAERVDRELAVLEALSRRGGAR